MQESRRREDRIIPDARAVVEIRPPAAVRSVHENRGGNEDQKLFPLRLKRVPRRDHVVEQNDPPDLEAVIGDRFPVLQDIER